MYHGSDTSVHVEGDFLHFEISQKLLASFVFYFVPEVLGLIQLGKHESGYDLETS